MRPPATPLRVAFDTNVLLSLYAFSDSRFRVLREAVREGVLISLTSPACHAEWERVLTYRALRLDPQRRVAAAIALAGECEWVHAPQPGYLLPRCKDPDDQKFLELARDGRAHYLVSLDRALLGLAQKRPLRDHLRILTPQAMQRVIAG
jgi:putative PIN family toxin of toxin-antitoxin system